MKTALVTGGTGMVGNAIVGSLLARGHRVRALVRSLDKGRALLPAGVELVQGDITQPETLAPATAGCDWVFHAAGFPEQWMKDRSTFDRINAEGTANMIAASAGKRFIFTSTIDVFTWRSGETYDESEIDPDPKGTHYERSKQKADKLVVESGLDAVFLHPSAVYGTGPSDSPGVNDLIVRLAKNKVPGLLPGGMPVVFAADAGEGHVRAAERGATGARFILSERYYTLSELATAILQALAASPSAGDAHASRSPIDRKPPRVLPRWLASTIANVGAGLSAITGKPPLLPKGQLSFLQVDSYPTAKRADAELGLAFTPLAEGLARTVEYLRASGKL